MSFEVQSNPLSTKKKKFGTKFINLHRTGISYSEDNLPGPESVTFSGVVRVAASIPRADARSVVDVKVSTSSRSAAQTITLKACVNAITNMDLIVVQYIPSQTK